MGVRVNGLNYYVKTCLPSFPAAEYGSTDFDIGEVRIVDNISPEKQRQTFWHEIVHILLEGEDFKEAQEEKFVTRFSNLLYAMMTDNQILAKDWWTRVLDETPDYSQVMIGQPARVAARGRKHSNTTNCRRKK